MAFYDEYLMTTNQNVISSFTFMTFYRERYTFVMKVRCLSLSTLRKHHKLFQYHIVTNTLSFLWQLPCVTDLQQCWLSGPTIRLKLNIEKMRTEYREKKAQKFKTENKKHKNKGAFKALTKDVKWHPCMLYHQATSPFVFSCGNSS